jgi:hypothetical protein
MKILREIAPASSIIQTGSKTSVYQTESYSEQEQE